MKMIISPRFYVVDDADRFYGAIDLKDLIIARETDELDGIISTSYPYVTDHEKIDNCIETIKDYAEDSLPVLTDSGKLIGILTAQDIVEAVDDELGEDYSKAGWFDRRRRSARKNIHQYQKTTAMADHSAVSRHGSIFCGRRI